MVISNFNPKHRHFKYIATLITEHMYRYKTIKNEIYDILLLWMCKENNKYPYWMKLRLDEIKTILENSS